MSLQCLAEGGGFEPPVPCDTLAFQASTIGHSVTPPQHCAPTSPESGLARGANDNAGRIRGKVGAARPVNVTRNHSNEPCFPQVFKNPSIRRQHPISSIFAGASPFLCRKSLYTLNDDDSSREKATDKPPEVLEGPTDAPARKHAQTAVACPVCASTDRASQRAEAGESVTPAEGNRRMGNRCR